MSAGYTTGQWSGIDNHQCDQCAYASTDVDEIVRHVMAHRVADVSGITGIEGYSFEYHPGGYFKVYDEDGVQVPGPSGAEMKFQGRDAAAAGALAHARGVPATAPQEE